MNKKAKLLDQMRANPRGDWTIEDIAKVASQYEDQGLRIDAPARGSHFKVSHPGIAEILTIPAKRPIKPVYIRKFVSIIDSIT